MKNKLFVFLFILLNSILLAQSPVANFTATPKTVCVGQSVYFSDLSTGTPNQWQWSFNGGTPNASTSQNPIITYNTPGTYNVVLTVWNANGNDTKTRTAYIVVSGTSVNSNFTISKDPACSGESVNFYNSGDTGGSYTYSWDFGSGATPATSTQENPMNVVYSTPGAKTILHAITAPSGCTSVTTNMLTVNPSPVSTFTSTAPACRGNLVNFTCTGVNGAGTNYAWDLGTDANPGTSNSQNPSGIKYSTSGTKFVTLTLLNSFNCFSATTNTISIQNKPTAAFISTSQQCTGVAVTFNNTGTNSNVSYLWDFGSGASPSTANTAAPSTTYSTTGNKNISLILTDISSSCKDTATNSVLINPGATASFTSNSPICARAPVNFTNTGSNSSGLVYQWDFGINASPPSSSIRNPTGVTYSSPGTKYVTLSVTNSYNCISVVTDSVLILDRPVASFASTAPACTGSPVDFSYVGNDLGIKFKWDLGQSASPATSQNSNPSTVYSSAGIKIIRMIAISNCEDTTEGAITIFTSPDVGFSNNAPKCAGSNVNFTNTGSSGNNWLYSWSFDGGASPSQSNAENPMGVKFEYGGNKIVNLTISDAHCYKTFSDTISIYDLPLADAGIDTVICSNGSVQIGSDSLPNCTYQWTPVALLDNATIANPIASPVAPTTDYVVNVKNTITKCTNADTVTITMLAPLIADAGPDKEICIEQSTPIGSGPVKGQSYVWYPSTGLNDTQSSSPIANPVVTTTYTLAINASGCGPIYDEVKVTVNSLPIANAGPDATIAKGEKTQLIATGGIQYLWSPAANLNNPGVSDPIATPTDNTVYTVMVTDIKGCVNSDQVTVFVNTPSFWLPTAFTPDGNGKNDVLFVRGVGVTSFEFTIFDRWGQQVFYTRDPNRGWDGRKDPSGEDMPIGAYVYYLKGTTSDGHTIAEQGMINLIR